MLVDIRKIKFIKGFCFFKAFMQFSLLTRAKGSEIQASFGYTEETVSRSALGEYTYC